MKAKELPRLKGHSGFERMDWDSMSITFWFSYGKIAAFRIGRRPIVALQAKPGWPMDRHINMIKGIEKGIRVDPVEFANLLQEQVAVYMKNRKRGKKHI